MLITLSVTAACGTATGERAAPSSEIEFAAIEAQANDISTRIGGDAREREAAHYLAVGALNKDFIACMGQADFDVASPFHPIFAGWEPNATTGLWMGELNRPLSPRALALAESTRSEFEGARGPAYNKAALGCEQQTDTDDPSSMLREPEGWLELVGKYSALVNEVDAQLGPISEYTDCMKEAGIDYVKLNGEDALGYSGLYLALEGVMPAAPLPDEEPTTEWTQYLELEADAMAADVACREERYHKGLSLLAPKLDEFEAESHDAIEAMHGQWQRVLEEAQSLNLPL